ncbi:hypothetical protein [Plantactinospora soyae]|uniref:Diadenosine tetraphosphatase ApaH/serine/threonine PP2A family protein phosphatase n=1 Tax=Plantactinospora soyae TaxID=1544732 RepID=A0A927QWD2_9ACTN|nr:hypothetical protein [Plantactinospora soyae]MBE1486765.1 diadenosine tetraphosphatase ApaH/serine/threonine PP2A family protein phosphatase [Plantactinospora soyae]
MTEPRWVIHLPTTITSRDAAIDLVDALRTSLTHVPVLDFGEATLSEEDEQSRRTRIWCDAPVGEPRAGPGSRRCTRFVGHPGGCGSTRG